MLATTPISIEIAGNLIHGQQFGKGPKVLIAFHGFGQDHRFFQPLATLIQSEYTIWALDLPFHGHTNVQLDAFQPLFIAEIIAAIYNRTGHVPLGVMGFSYGARILLGSLPYIKSYINQLIILSPEGIATNQRFWLDLIPISGRKLISKSLKQTDWLIQIGQFLNRNKLLGDFSVRFLKRYLASDQRRSQLFQSWIALGHFPVHKKQLINTLKEYKQHTLWILGEQDSIINVQRVAKYVHTLPYASLYIIEGNHFLQWNTVENILLEQGK